MPQHNGRKIFLLNFGWSCRFLLVKSEKSPVAYASTPFSAAAGQCLNLLRITTHRCPPPFPNPLELIGNAFIFMRR